MSFQVFLSFQDYTDHINELSNKLVSIMDSTLDLALAKVLFGLYTCILQNNVVHGLTRHVLLVTVGGSGADAIAEFSQCL